MTNRFENLVTSPYDDEPRRNRSVVRWLLGIGVVAAAVVVIAVLFAGGDEPAEEASVSGASATASSIPGASDGEGSGTGNGAAVDAPDDQPVSELAFDTTAFGSEQVLGEIDEEKLNENWGLILAGSLVDEERFLVGSIPQKQLDLVGATGLGTNPSGDSFGGPTMCVALVGPQGASHGGCFVNDEAGATRPLFTGLLQTGVVAWGLLPDAASIGVLTVNDKKIAWQRPVLGFVAFRYDVFPGEQIELVVLSDMGTEIDRGTRHKPPESTNTYVEPIAGYGDYTDVAFEDLDFAEVDDLIVGCMNDNDVAAVTGTRSLPYSSIDLSSIPEDDLATAYEYLARCRMGLNLPSRPTITDAQWEERYEQSLELHSCLAELGYELEAAPPLDVWVQEPTETRWDPILMMDILFPHRMTEAMDACSG